MMFKSLASSSHGNAYIVGDGSTHILIECGLPYAKLNKAANFKLHELSACLVSHEHKDHSKSVRDLICCGMPIYMSAGTAEALETELVEVIEAGEQFTIGTLDVLPFSVFHDANEPLGFLIKSRVDGEVFVFATDTVNLRYRFPGLNTLAIECNFDPKILERSQKLPEKIKKRITNSHMSIDVLCEYLGELDLSVCGKLYLLHLSDGMSDEWAFYERIKAIVPVGTKVIVCEK